VSSIVKNTEFGKQKRSQEEISASNTNINNAINTIAPEQHETC
jgi:hypothetical protein